MKSILYSLYCAVTGRGGHFLAHKQEYHKRRQKMEKELLEKAVSHPDLFEKNICPVCETEKEPERRFCNPIGFGFAVCPDCKTVYIDPAPTESTLTYLYNHPSESFMFNKDEGTDKKITASHHDDYYALLRMLGDQHKQGMRLLEVGCSNGSFLMTAKGKFEVEGVELNDSTAEVARRHGFNVKTGRISDIEGENLYDVIVMLQVLEHIVRPSELLKDVFRLLKPGGFLYVDVPNVDSASFNYLQEKHIHISSYGHVTMFNRESLVKLCERYGLNLVQHEFCGGRDFEFHDLLTYKLANGKFYHRMALYNPRLYFADQLLKQITFDAFGKLLLPKGNESYQRAMFRKI